MKNYTNHNTHVSDSIKNSPLTTALSTETPGNFISIILMLKKKSTLKRSFIFSTILTTKEKIKAPVV